MHASFKNTLTIGIVLLSGGAGLHAADAANKPALKSHMNPEGDNSKINKRDDAVTSPTAGQQDNNKQDIEITRKIRRALTENDALSIYAHNIKIITQSGEVVLKGPVRSAEEKRIAEAVAINTVGASHVKSELEVTVQ